MFKRIRTYFRYKNSVLYLGVMLLACLGAYGAAGLEVDRMLAAVLQTGCYLAVFLTLQRIGAIVMDISNSEDSE